MTKTGEPHAHRGPRPGAMLLTAALIVGGGAGGYIAGTPFLDPASSDDHAPTQPTSHMDPATASRDSTTDDQPRKSTSGEFQPVADDDWQHEAEPDQVTTVHDMASNDTTTGQNDTSTDGVEATESTTPTEADSDETGQPATDPSEIEMAVRIETVGHFALITVPVIPGSAPLTSLEVDLGEAPSSSPTRHNCGPSRTARPSPSGTSVSRPSPLKPSESQQS